MLKALLFPSYRRISSEIIKKSLEKQLINPNIHSFPEYPRTFEQKIILLNDPRTIQKL